MQKHVYEYAVIRVVPKVEREEFLNVGIILFSKSARFLRVHLYLDEAKMNLLSGETDCEQIRANLSSFEKICNGKRDGGPIALEEIPERFRWLTAQRSSVIQTSRPHPGISDNLEKTCERLFEELVK